MRPLVLIAALRRTGSTMLAEALTELPRAFVFREPRVFLGHVDLKPADLARLRERLGLDVAGAALRRADPAAPARFVADVWRPMRARVEQVGLKEIRYGERWREALDALGAAGPVRVVALGRDPRDIYLSLAERARVRRIHLDGPFGAESVARDLAREFAAQRALVEATGALAVRYEDLCTDASVLAGVREFVDSPVRGTGALGEFSPRNRELHAGRLTTRSIARWREEPDAALVAAATETRDRLSDYCRFWGYPT